MNELAHLLEQRDVAIKLKQEMEQEIRLNEADILERILTDHRKLALFRGVIKINYEALKKAMR